MSELTANCVGLKAHFLPDQTAIEENVFRPGVIGQAVFYSSRLELLCPSCTNAHHKQIRKNVKIFGCNLNVEKSIIE